MKKNAGRRTHWCFWASGNVFLRTKMPDSRGGSIDSITPSTGTYETTLVSLRPRYLQHDPPARFTIVMQTWAQRGPAAVLFWRSNEIASRGTFGRGRPCTTVLPLACDPLGAGRGGRGLRRQPGGVCRLANDYEVATFRSADPGNGTAVFHGRQP